jgi:hypothetical protein
MEIDVTRKSNENPTGWTAYVAAYKAAHPDAIIDGQLPPATYKALMQQYIKGVALPSTGDKV